MLYADGKQVGLREAVKLLDYKEMREKGIESFSALIYLVKKLLKKGLSKEKKREIGNKEVSDKLDVNGYISRLEAEGNVEKINGEYRFKENHWIMK